jgi:hypothetical protein
METLSAHSPVLAGTYPIGISIPGSDLDIICSYNDIDAFERTLDSEYADMKGYSMKRKFIRDRESVIARFLFDGFDFEIFGQSIPVNEQYAYRHMLIEDRLLRKHGTQFRKKILELKSKGLSTEEAFAKILGIKGDPYEELLNFEL